MKYFILFKIKRLTPSWYIIAGLVFFVHYNISHLKSGFAEISGSVEKLGWREIQFVDKKSNRFSKCGQGCIQVDSDSAVSMIQRSLKIDITEKKFLSWEWKLAVPPAPSDLARKGKDDRPLAVYITFPFDYQNASMSERAMRPLLEFRYGSEAPGRVLSYVWASAESKGKVIESPFGGTQHKMIVKRNNRSRLGVWLEEKVDILADYKDVFGGEPKSVSHILISSDTDDTLSFTTGFVKIMQFTPH